LGRRARVHGYPHDGMHGHDKKLSRATVAISLRIAAADGGNTDTVFRKSKEPPPKFMLRSLIARTSTEGQVEE